ncbi:MAG: N-acetyltransferase family protein [Campylobacter sp.]|nr:N-acetyltransferase family protein [Campylobacter sp.]
MTEIYNDAVSDKNATADLRTVSVQSRERWFDAHGENRPIYVLKDKSGKILAWCSLSDYYPREAYRITAEISLYVRKDARGKGVGKELLAHVLNLALNFGIYNIVAVIFADNAASVNLFRNFGFEEWGNLPKVCVLGENFKDILILGKKLI